MQPFRNDQRVESRPSESQPSGQVAAINLQDEAICGACVVIGLAALAGGVANSVEPRLFGPGLILGAAVGTELQLRGMTRAIESATNDGKTGKLVDSELRFPLDVRTVTATLGTGMVAALPAIVFAASTAATIAALSAGVAAGAAWSIYQYLRER